MRTRSRTVSRRVILQAALAATGGVGFASGGTMASPEARGGRTAHAGLAPVKALVFDNPYRFYTQANSEFFKGTRIEQKLQAQPQKRAA